jgi:hypothetical protein
MTITSIPAARTPLDYFARVVILVSVEKDMAIDYRSLTGNAVSFSGTSAATAANFRILEDYTLVRGCERSTFNF